MVSTRSEMGSYRRMELLQWLLTRSPFPDINTTWAELNELLRKGLIEADPLAHMMSDAYDIPDNAYVEEPPKMKAYVLTDEGKRELELLQQEWNSSP